MSQLPAEVTAENAPGRGSNEQIKATGGTFEIGSVIRKYWITAADDKPYEVNHYNLQIIIAVGFMVNSERAVQFRKWINGIASEYTIKGWVKDNGKVSMEIAKLHAETEFEKYRIVQDQLFLSDFDKYMLELKKAAAPSQSEQHKE